MAGSSNISEERLRRVLWYTSRPRLQQQRSGARDAEIVLRNSSTRCLPYQDSPFTFQFRERRKGSQNLYLESHNVSKSLPNIIIWDSQTGISALQPPRPQSQYLEGYKRIALPHCSALHFIPKRPNTQQCNTRTTLVSLPDKWCRLVRLTTSSVSHMSIIGRELLSLPL